MVVNVFEEVLADILHSTETSNLCREVFLFHILHEAVRWLVITLDHGISLLDNPLELIVIIDIASYFLEIHCLIANDELFEPFLRSLFESIDESVSLRRGVIEAVNIKEIFLFGLGELGSFHLQICF